MFLLVSICALSLFTTNGYANSQSIIANPLLTRTAHQIASAYGTEKVFSISRNGKKIGTHTLRFHKDPDQLTVSVDSSITVTILRIPVYRLSYVAEEVWQNNTLISASATTIENGEGNTVSWTFRDDSPIKFATNHWHPGVLTGNAVFNTLTGETDIVQVKPLEIEQIETLSGTVVSARRYQYENEASLNVWYDTNGLWLKMKFNGEDGSVIRYLRTD